MFSHGVKCIQNYRSGICSLEPKIVAKKSAEVEM